MAVRKTANERVYNLDGEGGNVYALMGYVLRLLTPVYSNRDIDILRDEFIRASSYEQVLRIANREVGAHVIWETNNDDYFKILSE